MPKEVNNLVHTRVGGDLFRAIQARAKAEGRTMAAQVRYMLGQLFNVSPTRTTERTDVIDIMLQDLKEGNNNVNK